MDKFNKPLITVIIPVYNGKNFLNRAVESVLKQPMSQLIEVLLIDDGSTDTTGTLCDELASLYTNVYTVHKSNGGCASARNTGIDNANGLYLTCLDQDDVWNKNFFDQDVVGKISSGKIDLYEFSYMHISNNGLYVKEYHIQESTEYFDKNERGRYDWSCHWRFLYRTQFIKDNNLKYLEIAYNEDIPYVEMCHYLAKSIEKIDKMMYIYQSNNSSITHSINIFDCINGRYQSFIISRDWFANYGEEYDIDYSTLMLIASSLPDVCANNKYRDAVGFFMEDERFFEVLKKYKSINMHSSLKRIIYFWMKYPLLFFIYSKTFYKCMKFMKKFFYNHPTIRRPFDYINYKIIKKYDYYKF